MINNGEAVYQRIKNEIKQKIVNGEIGPSDLLPSESSLAQAYNTSRVTIRKSLQVLEHEGYIYSWPGKGYFVSKPKHDEFTLVFDEGNGSDVDYKNVTVVTPDKEVQDALGISEGSLVIKICRVLKQKDIPVAYDIKYLPYVKGMPSIEMELRYAAFPEIVAKKVPPFAFYTELEIYASLSNGETSRMLECEDNEPLLVATRHFVDQRGEKIAYGKMSMRACYGNLRAFSGYPPELSSR